MLKVVQGLFDGVGVVQADQVGIQLGQLAVHQHHRQFAVQGAQFAGVVAEGVHDQSFDVVGLQGGQVMTLLLVVAVGIAHHQAVAVFAAGGFHAMHDGHGVGVEDVRHQHSDQPCAPALEASGHLVGAVVELVDGALDAPGGGIGEQLAVAADIARHAGFETPAASATWLMVTRPRLGSTEPFTDLVPLGAVLIGVSGWSSPADARS